MTGVFTDEQLALIRRRRNEGDGIDDIVTELRLECPEVTREEVRLAFRAGLPALKTKIPRGRMPHSSAGAPVQPPPAALADLAARKAAPFRDLTGLIMGDPPRGFSALDRRGAVHG